MTQEWYELKKIFRWFVTRIPFYFLFFILPVLVMLSCEGWNTANVATQRCAIDLPIVRLYADNYFAFVTFSAYLLAIPILIYIVVLIIVSEKLGARFNNRVFGAVS